MKTVTSSSSPVPPVLPVFMTLHNASPIYYQNDWHVGMGGGLWSSGLALAHYLGSDAAAQTLATYLVAKQQIQQQQRKHNNNDNYNNEEEEEEEDTVSSLSLHVLELGAGNGLVSACWLALVKHVRQQLLHSQNQFSFAHGLVVTDTADHLPLIRQTLEANGHRIRRSINDHNNDSNIEDQVHVIEHVWGEEEYDPVLAQFDTDSASASASFSFDVILASDVAYHPDLYKSLMTSLRRLARPSSTLIYLGITKVDTPPAFFHALTAAGFEYRRLHHSHNSNSTTAFMIGDTSMFGILCLQLHSSVYRTMDNRSETITT